MTATVAAYLLVVVLVGLTANVVVLTWKVLALERRLSELGDSFDQLVVLILGEPGGDDDDA